MSADIIRNEVIEDITVSSKDTHTRVPFFKQFNFNFSNTITYALSYFKFAFKVASNSNIHFPNYFFYLIC